MNGWPLGATSENLNAECLILSLLYQKILSRHQAFRLSTGEKYILASRLNEKTISQGL